MGSTIELRIAPRRRPVGSGEVRRLLPHRSRRMVGPFVFCDLIGPDELGPGTGVDIDAHPHIGLSTVTYLLDGRMVHRDSTGAVATIEPGGVNWMTAGSGVTHTERSHPDDRAGPARLHGVQTWVALPDDAEEQPASFQHAGAAAVPVDTGRGGEVRVAVGTGWGLESPVRVSSPLVLAEVRIAAGATVALDATHPERAVLAVDGDVRVGGDVLAVGHLAVISPGSRPALTGPGTAVVIGGEPLGPRHIWWNFVHHDLDRIEQAKRDWAEQRFAPVPGDHDPWVPLPG